MCYTRQIDHYCKQEYCRYEETPLKSELLLVRCNRGNANKKTCSEVTKTFPNYDIFYSCCVDGQTKSEQKLIAWEHAKEIITQDVAVLERKKEEEQK